MRNVLCTLITVLFASIGFAQVPQPGMPYPQPVSPPYPQPAPMPSYQPAATPFVMPANPAAAPQMQMPQGAPYSPISTSEVTTVVASGDKNLFATLETSMGKIKVELYATIVPRTVRNFVELANGQKDFVDVKTGRRERRDFYDGMIFHKVIKGFTIQTGCPYGTGKGGPGFTIPDEISTSLRHDKPGVVSMANVGPNTNGSQFFITLSPQPELDDKYSVFGQVIEGMDVVRKISNVKVGPTDRPLKRVFLKRVVISE